MVLPWCLEQLLFPIAAIFRNQLDDLLTDTSAQFCGGSVNAGSGSSFLLRFGQNISPSVAFPTAAQLRIVGGGFFLYRSSFCFQHFNQVSVSFCEFSYAESDCLSNGN